jgi:hypothetical protein
MTAALEAEFRYYREHQDELVREHNGKFVVIHGAQVLGVYDTYEQAYAATVQDHPVGTFLIQHVEPGEGAYTQTFHSRVA